jgi:hypothetical protein
MKFIIDKEIALEEGNDALNGKSYSNTLVNTIKNAPNDKSFTIGLFGEWGSGKSSIVETAKLELEEIKDEKIKFIVYDAWKYANDSFRRMFLLKVQESLNFDRTNLMNSFYLNESEDVEIKKSLNKTNIVVILLIMIIGIILVNALPIAADSWKLPFSIFVSFLGLLTTIFFKAFDEFKINIQKPHLFAPEQFEDCFIEMLSKSLKDYSFVEKAFLWIKGENHEKDIDKLIIVIDNIDRCHKELAYELLTDTKSFLGQAKQVVFLIPVDDQALKKHILSSNANNQEAEEFLRKFFNVTIRIKPLKPIELFDFANKINIEYELGLNPDTIDIVSREYASNPRRIIQFFNNLTVELHNFKINFDDNFIVKHESLICKLLILREEWPDFYKLLSQHPYLVNETNEDKSKIISESKDLSIFLKGTQAISKTVNINVFESLLSNGKVFEKLTTEVKDAIQSQDTDTLIKFISDSIVQKNEILKYSFSELEKGLNRKSYSTLVSRIFNFLISFNSIEGFELTNSNNRKIQNLIGSELSNFIKNTENINHFVTYINSLTKQDFSYLTNHIIDEINTEFEPTGKVKYDEFYYSLLPELANNLIENKLLKRLNYSFSNYVIIKGTALKDLIFLNRVKYLVSEQLINHLIEELKPLESKSAQFADLVFIAGGMKLPSTTNENIFRKLNTIHPNFTNKSKEFLIDASKDLSSLLNNLNYKGETPETSSFITKVLSNRPLQNRQVNIINETINTPEEISVLIDLLEKIFKAARGSINVSSYYNTIIKSNEANRKLVNSSFLNLKHTHGFSLIPISDIILSDVPYDEDSLELLTEIFSYKDDKGVYKLEINKLNAKVKQMAEIIFSNSESSVGIISFFENLISVPPVNKSLANIISGRTKEEILRLSPSLLKLAFDKITEADNLFNYQGDLEVLKAIGESGEKSHVVKLTKIILSDLQKEETYKDAFEVISSCVRFNDRDAQNLIGNLESLLDNENYKEEVTALIKNLKEK